MKRFSSQPGIPPDSSGRIKGLRERFGLTQAQLAGLLGVSAGAVAHWETGRAHPSFELWLRVARAEQLGLDALSKDGANPSHDSNLLLGETGAEYQTTVEPISVDFAASPEAVRLAVEAHRLEYGHLFNPAFATEVSLIDPLPHQRLAVYEHMLQQTPLRFLLADDAGAGKTIMTGLYLREMLSRKLIQRVLIVPPAGLVGNWERELRTLFSLSFRIIGGKDLKGNPFVGPESNPLIISLDTLAGERAFSRLQQPSVAPYDLVVFDEAHKLSADREPDFTIRKTDRYRLAEALAGLEVDDKRWELSWSAQHLLLLTATPHMGKDYPYYCLWRLLEPEALPTLDAFNNYPPEERQRHFVRRTKEELVSFDGRPIYPTRISDTLSYALKQGEVSEQTLYDETTNYIQNYYNHAQILNRSAVRLAMSVFQRRLASSNFALLRSLERRLAKLEELKAKVEAGLLALNPPPSEQRKLDQVEDPLDTGTADEEEFEPGQEAHELAEDELLGGVTARSLEELETERVQVLTLLDLAQKVYALGDESKFEKLREVLRDPSYANEKFIIFTEHYDTLNFLIHRLQGLGFTGQIAQIHGGMDYQQREEQVAFFKKPLGEGGARYLLATDAAGEGINLQFCWMMVNYDIPWNPARLEQRMGRIHRYGQQHDPVVIMNLAAGKTHEGRVMLTLLEKLERIRKELGTDKVFDVIGRLFEGVSLRQYMEQATLEGADKAENALQGKLTKEQVEAIRAREQRLYGDGGDVRRELPRLRSGLEQETYRRLLPGYTRRFLEQAAPLVNIGLEGDLSRFFTFRPLVPGALDSLWPVIARYSPQQRQAMTIYRPMDKEQAIFLHPGEPVFERFRSLICDRLERPALQGAVFVDPSANRRYFFHVVRLSVIRQADLTMRALSRLEIVESRLFGLRQELDGSIAVSPVEHLLLLQDGHGLTPEAIPLVATADSAVEQALTFVREHLIQERAEQHRQRLQASLAEREQFISRGYKYQSADLAEARIHLRDRANAGDPQAKALLTRIRERQNNLLARRDLALAVIRHEAELVEPGEITFLAHTLVMPSSDPEDKKRQDEAVESRAVEKARAHEEARGAIVLDVSTPQRALTDGLGEHPGFDLLSKRPDGQELAIEVKGRARMGSVEMTENEWRRSCNLGERYWLYAVFDCDTTNPRLVRVQAPFRKLIAHLKGSVVLELRSILEHAEEP